MQVSEAVEITGHLMDSGVLARILDDVLDYGGDYTVDYRLIDQRPRPVLD